MTVWLSTPPFSTEGTLPASASFRRAPPDALKGADVVDTHVSQQPRTLSKEREGWEVTTLNFSHVFCHAHSPPGKCEDLFPPAERPVLAHHPLVFLRGRGRARIRVGGKGVPRETGSKVTKDLICWCDVYWMALSCLREVRHG